MSEPRWKIILSDEAKEDMRSLDGSQRVEVFRSIKKDVIVQQDAKNYGLTERETEFIRLICDGCDNKEIAAKLFLAEGTVRNGISRLLEKLELKDRTQLAVFAIKNNIV